MLGVDDNLQNYKVLPNLAVNDTLLQELISVNWVAMPGAFKLTSFDMLKDFIKTEVPLVHVFATYGWRLQKVSKFFTVKLPAKIEKQIHDNWPFLNKMPELPFIRLQIVYGGMHVPLHIDKTRSASLIYPLKNHGSAVTNFYSSEYTFSRRGMVDPSKCSLVESIKIDQCPVLLNVDQIHDVKFLEPASINNARVSLNLKWEKMKYNQVLSFFPIDH